MAFVEKTAKTVEEAVAAALQELNITKEEAVIEVLQEAKKGFLGFFGQDAKVRVTVKEAAVEAPAEAVEEEKGELNKAMENLGESLAAVAAAATAEVEKKVADIKEKVEQDTQEAKEAVVQKVSEAKEEIGKKAAKVKEDAVDGAIDALNSLKGEKPAKDARKYVVNDEAVNTAKEFLQKVFNAIKIEVVMEKFINKNDGTVTFKLHGDDMGILIGKHGQTLDSLQYLTNLVANKNSSERVRVIIDVEDYRDRRIETLTRLAHRLADKVKRNGERVALEPMNPHERKIIHMALQSDRKVTTLSEGDEPYRHVVIELKK